MPCWEKDCNRTGTDLQEMSNSLVHKSLELLGYDNTIKQGKKKRSRVTYKGTLNLIPRKHRVISKNDKTDLSTVLTQSKRISVCAVKRQTEEAQQDPMKENIRKLLRLSTNRIDLEARGKIFDRAVEGRCVPNEKKFKEPEKTVFTEEDFEMFEQEYVE